MNSWRRFCLLSAALAVAVVLGAVGRVWGSAGSDEFNNMIRSAGSFDMDSPVETRAEFDPPESVVGGEVVYRVSATVLDESFEVPEHLVTPDGLVLERGGRWQIYEPTGGNKIRPRLTIVYHAKLTTNGTFAIPAFQAMAYGKPVEVPSATLTVAPAGSTPPPRPPLLLATPPAGDIYVGEALTIHLVMTLEPPHQVPILQEPRVTADFIFSEQYVSPPRQETVVRDGETVPAIGEDVTITPLRSGPQRFVGQGFTYLTHQTPGQPGFTQPQNDLLDSEPFTLDVKPLPTDGQLPGFLGAVGQYKIDPPSLSSATVGAGEPLTLSVLIHGEANIGRIAPPAPPVSKDWQTFPAQSEDLEPEDAHRVGSVRFTYTLIPLNGHIKSTPPIPFSAFDPETKSYVDLTVPAVPVTVTGSGLPGSEQTASSPAAAGSSGGPGSAEDEEPIFAGLRKSPGSAVGGLAAIEGQWWFGALQLTLFFGLAGIWAWDRRRRFLREHPEVILKARARRGLRRQLRLARRAAAARDAAGFARGAAGALREACAPHERANPAALVCADVLEELPPAERQGGGETVRRLFAAADALNFGGPSRDSAELLALQPDLERLLEKLEERL